MAVAALPASPRALRYTAQSLMVTAPLARPMSAPAAPAAAVLQAPVRVTWSMLPAKLENSPTSAVLAEDTVSP